jgi:hypothetical protein
VYTYVLLVVVVVTFLVAACAGSDACTSVFLTVVCVWVVFTGDDDIAAGEGLGGLAANSRVSSRLASSGRMSGGERWILQLCTVLICKASRSSDRVSHTALCVSCSVASAAQALACSDAEPLHRFILPQLARR